MPSMGVHGSEETAGWVDLAGNAPNTGGSHGGARRRRSEGVGADRLPRFGADAAIAVAERLAEITEVGWWDRLRGRRPLWRVLLY
jgi:hypothetical protein